MDLKQIKQIIELMKRAELNEFAVEEEGFKLKIRRGGAGGPTRTSNPPFVVAADNPAYATTPPIPMPAAAPAPAAANPAATGGDPAEDKNVTYIKSPMVGTFYSAPSPDAKPFADNGSKVSETSVVCIIEAMKIMNEIQAEVKGTVLEVLVENGEPVEYGQRLFKVKTT